MRKSLAILMVTASLVMSPLGAPTIHASSDIPAQAKATVSSVRENVIAQGMKYLGNGKILQTYSKESGGVRIDNIEGTQWEKRFFFGGSVLE
ncbi:hypothetical protein [Paenibacillus macerans]|uniref:hypothetical protein n=1 Tax=Paenibacillus macerans TaxID=44252 RepID=UPI003D320419